MYAIIPAAYVIAVGAAVFIWGLRLDKDENPTTSLSFVLYCGMLAAGTSNIVSGRSDSPASYASEHFISPFTGSLRFGSQVPCLVTVTMLLL